MALKLERSAEALAQGLGSQPENNSEHFPIARVIQPVMSVEDIVQRSEYPSATASLVSPAAGGGRNSVVELLAVSEMRITHGYPTVAINWTLSRLSFIQTNLTELSARTEQNVLPTRARCFVGDRAGTVADSSFSAAASNQGIFPILVPQGCRLVLSVNSDNTAIQFLFRWEERDGRVLRTLGA